MLWESIYVYGNLWEIYRSLWINISIGVFINAMGVCAIVVTVRFAFVKLRKNIECSSITAASLRITWAHSSPTFSLPIFII